MDHASTLQATPRRLRSAVTRAMADDTPPIVSVEWLKERLGDPGIKVLDASWFLPSMGACHVPPQSDVEKTVGIPVALKETAPERCIACHFHYNAARGPFSCVFTQMQPSAHPSIHACSICGCDVRHICRPQRR